MNVLLTSAGRRSYLVEWFKAALGGRGRVVVANSEAGTAGMLAGDEAVVVAPALSAGYAESIAELCVTREIGLLCSLHDLDSYVLAQRPGGFGPARSTLPSPEWARRCLDKLECHQYLSAHGIASPWTSNSLEDALTAIERGELSLPVMVKPRFGFGSLGARRCDSRSELCDEFARGQRQLAVPQPLDVAGGSLIIQAFLDGEEYCLNLVNDLNGRPQARFASRIEALRAGESERASTVAAEHFASVAEPLEKLTGHRGIWGIDLRVSADGPQVIDINPRFTGDYPFQHLAGANVPAALLAWASGQRPEPAWLQPRHGVRGFKDIVPRTYPAAP